MARLLQDRKIRSLPLHYWEHDADRAPGMDPGATLWWIQTISTMNFCSCNDANLKGIRLLYILILYFLLQARAEKHVILEASRSRAANISQSKENSSLLKIRICCFSVSFMVAHKESFNLFWTVVLLGEATDIMMNIFHILWSKWLTN